MRRGTAAAIGLALALLVAACSDDANEFSAADSTTVAPPAPDDAAAPDPSTAPPAAADGGGGEAAATTTTASAAPDSEVDGGGPEPTSPNPYRQPTKPEGGCLRPSGEVVTISIGAAGFDPSCVTVAREQRLTVQNTTDAEVVFIAGNIEGAIGGQDVLEWRRVGYELGPGDHVMWSPGNYDWSGIITVVE